MRELLQIGEVAKLIGVSPKTIRYYHEIGLLAEPKRTGSDTGSILHKTCCVCSVFAGCVRWGYHLTASRRFLVRLMLDKKSCSGMRCNRWLRSLPHRF